MYPWRTFCKARNANCSFQDCLLDELHAPLQVQQMSVFHRWIRLKQGRCPQSPHLYDPWSLGRLIVQWESLTWESTGGLRVSLSPLVRECAPVGNSSSKSQSEQWSQPSVSVPKTLHLQKLIKNRCQNHGKQKCIIQNRIPTLEEKGTNAGPFVWVFRQQFSCDEWDARFLKYIIRWNHLKTAGWIWNYWMWKWPLKTVLSFLIRMTPVLVLV